MSSISFAQVSIPYEKLYTKYSTLETQVLTAEIKKTKYKHQNPTQIELTIEVTMHSGNENVLFLLENNQLKLFELLHPVIYVSSGSIEVIQYLWRPEDRKLKKDQSKGISLIVGQQKVTGKMTKREKEEVLDLGHGRILKQTKTTYEFSNVKIAKNIIEKESK